MDGPSAILNGLAKFDRVAEGAQLPVASSVEGDSVSATQKRYGGRISITKDMRKFERYDQMQELVRSGVDYAFDRIDQSQADLQRTATNDPFGFGAEVLGLITAGGAAVGKTAQVNQAIGTAGAAAIRPVTKAASVVADKTSKAASFVTAQATGLDRSTISTALTKPTELKAARTSGLDRATLGSQLQSTIDTRIEELSDLGKGYEAIRTAEAPVIMPEGWFDDILAQHKITVDETGIFRWRRFRSCRLNFAYRQLHHRYVHDRHINFCGAIAVRSHGRRPQTQD